MKFLHAAAFAVALTLTSVPALRAQEPEQDKEKPKPQDEEKKKQPADKDKERPQPKPDDRANPKQQPDKEKPGRETDRSNPQTQRQDDRARQDNNARQDDRTRQDNRSATHEQRDANRGGGQRIPDEKYRTNFGEEHHFHVSRGGDRRFSYGGYAFEYAEAWPAEWSYDDDVYIVLVGDDYYLVDLAHPGVRLRLMLAD